MITLDHRHSFVDNLLYLVPENLGHVQKNGEVTPLLPSEPSSLRCLKRIFSIVALRKSICKAVEEVLYPLLSLFPLSGVHEARNLFTVVKHKLLSVSPLTLRNVGNFELRQVLFLLLLLSILRHLSTIDHIKGIVICCVKVYDLVCSMHGDYLLVVSRGLNWLSLVLLSLILLSLVVLS